MKQMRNDGKKKSLVLVLAGLLAYALSLTYAAPSEADAALCPPASALTACFDFTESAGVTNLKSTTVTPSKNGLPLAPIIIPASFSTGGGVQSSVINTVPCQSDTYTADAFSSYQVGPLIMNSLTVSATPGTGVLKDRTGEAPCMKPPTNFTGH